jgi:hypothetical protein
VGSSSKAASHPTVLSPCGEESGEVQRFQPHLRYGRPVIGRFTVQKTFIMAGRYFG